MSGVKEFDGELIKDTLRRHMSLCFDIKK